jgi:hypothetical protein
LNMFKESGFIRLSVTELKKAKIISTVNSIQKWGAHYNHERPWSGVC